MFYSDVKIGENTSPLGSTQPPHFAFPTSLPGGGSIAMGTGGRFEVRRPGGRCVIVVPPYGPFCRLPRALPMDASQTSSHL